MPEELKHCTRDLRFDRTKIDVEKRTVPISFSSEEPVERWGENEVLSHDKGDFDFSRLNNSHPLLLGHNERDPGAQIGVIEKAWVEDGKGRAIVRFSKSAKAQEIFQDVQDGIRELVSVGYDRTAVVSSKKDSNNMVTTRYRWMPTHIAIVPVPADTQVGVGREQVDSPEKANVATILESLTPEQKTNMRILLTPAAAEGGTAVDTVKITKDGANAERQRVKTIRATVEKVIKDFPHCAEQVRAMETEALGGEETPADFGCRILETVGKAKPVTETRMADLGMNEGEQKQYSILRAIQSIVNGDFRSRLPDGLELEVHQEMVKKARDNGGKAVFDGFMVPSDAPVRLNSHGRDLISKNRFGRDLVVNNFGNGGATVATQLITPIIEILRNKMVTSWAGVRTMSGLSGNVVIPRQAAAATAYSVAETAALTLSTQVLDQIALSPKRVGATNIYSKQLILQSSIDVENFVRDDMMKVIALDWDRLILNGQGAASEMLGIMNTPGIGSVIFGAAATYAKLVAFETLVAAANVMVSPGTTAYLTTPTAKGTLKSAAKFLTGGGTNVTNIALWEGNEINGYRANDSNQIPNNQMLYGDFDQFIHAIWGGLDVVVNPYTLAKNAEVEITMNTWGDGTCRHPQAFCVSADAANQ